MNEQSSVILEAKGVHKIYQHPVHKRNQVHVLKGVDLSIASGEALVIVGPSGAGKSTLLQIVGGLDKPTKGSLEFLGEDFYAMSETRRSALRNQAFGFVFQFYHLLPEFSAWENVALPMILGEPRGGLKAFKERALCLMDKVGLSDRADHKPNELSGGEQQRVSIARALANDPKVLLCDEPTGNLDSKNGQDVMDLLFELNKKSGRTLIIVTHDERFVNQTTKTVHLVDGHVQQIIAAIS